MTDIPWRVQQRLEFIEFQLYWEGGINRSNLIDHFQISVPQASLDLSLYQERAPSNLEYDKSKKRYLVTTNFKPKFFKPDSSAYFNNLNAIANRYVDISESWISVLPSYGILPMPIRTIKPKILKRVLEAIRNKKAIKIYYTSLSRPEPIWRWVSPLSLGNDGLRWHVRCFCHTHEEFRDFSLPRFLKIKSKMSSQPVIPYDDAWHEEIDVELRAAKYLTEGQKNTFAMDYGMNDGTFVTTVKKAMLFYFLRRLGFDTASIEKNISTYKLELTEPKKIAKFLADS